MDDTAENYLKSIYVLAFKVDEQGNEIYDYLAEPKDFSPTTEKEVTFTVTLYRSKEDYRFVVLTNCAEQITKLNLRKGK